MQNPGGTGGNFAVSKNDTGMNAAPSGERVHIGFFGCRNAGKSSLINAVAGQRVSIVSDTPGTTTDPVTKSMEILPMGPVVLIDTPGADDEGALGSLRVERTRRVLNRADIAVLVIPADRGPADCDRVLLEKIRARGVPYLIVRTKSELAPSSCTAGTSELRVSAATGEGIAELRECLARLMPQEAEPPLVRDLLTRGDAVVLVVPIDKAAPKGRLILPQQQVIRDALEAGAIPVVTRDTELPAALRALKEPPRMVITDSQAFGEVSKIVPESIALTSFSILMARHKGFLEGAVRGAAAMSALCTGDRILISEGCTHHRQCGDIGTVKLPAWLQGYTGKSLCFDTSSGADFPDDLSPYALILHCGGCMLRSREIDFRMRCAADAGVPMTNYGVAIAQLHGILRRALSVFPQLQALLP